MGASYWCDGRQLFAWKWTNAAACVCWAGWPVSVLLHPLIEKKNSLLGLILFLEPFICRGTRWLEGPLCVKMARVWKRRCPPPQSNQRDRKGSALGSSRRQWGLDTSTLQKCGCVCHTRPLPFSFQPFWPRLTRRLPTLISGGWRGQRAPRGQGVSPQAAHPALGSCWLCLPEGILEIAGGWRRGGVYIRSKTYLDLSRRQHIFCRSFAFRFYFLFPYTFCRCCHQREDMPLGLYCSWATGTIIVEGIHGGVGCMVGGEVLLGKERRGCHWDQSAQHPSPSRPLRKTNCNEIYQNFSSSFSNHPSHSSVAEVFLFCFV